VWEEEWLNSGYEAMRKPRVDESRQVRGGRVINIEVKEVRAVGSKCSASIPSGVKLGTGRGGGRARGRGPQAKGSRALRWVPPGSLQGRSEVGRTKAWFSCVMCGAGQ